MNGAAPADDLSAVADSALQEARCLQVDAAEVSVTAALGLSVTARLGDIETLEHSNDRALAVTVYQGGRKGISSVSDFSQQRVCEAVQAAARLARHTSQDEYAGLADAELMASEFPALDLDRPWDLAIERAVEMAIECEQAMRDVAQVTNTEGATVTTGRSTYCYANTHGFSHTVTGTRHSISGVAVADAKDGAGMQRDYWYSTHRHPERLESHHEVGRRAGERAVRRLGSRKVKTCKVPVLFEAPLAGGLLSQLAGAISGGALYRKASFLLDALGETLFPSFVQISERPHLPAALGSSAFDSEGVATRDYAVVKDGVLTSYVLDSYAARRLGLQTTGNAGGVHNWVFEGDTRALDALLEEMDKGLFVTELMGHGVNRVTGDYSLGAAGFWVEQGQVAYPVSKVTIAANLRDMFKHVVAVGDDVDTRGAMLCGSILIGEMTVAGD